MNDADTNIVKAALDLASFENLAVVADNTDVLVFTFYTTLNVK